MYQTADFEDWRYPHESLSPNKHVYDHSSLSIDIFAYIYLQYSGENEKKIYFQVKYQNAAQVEACLKDSQEISDSLQLSWI